MDSTTSPSGTDRTAVSYVDATETDPPRQTWDGAPIRPADDDLDLLAESNRKLGKFTVVLLAAVLAGLAFIGGVVVQKQAGGSTGGQPGGMSAMAGGGARGGYGQAGGFPGGGYGGTGGFGGAPGGSGTGDTSSAPGGQGSGTTDQGTADQGTTDQGTTASTPVVVGTVTKVSGRTLTVKNFAGKTVTVKVPKGTAITDSSDSALGGLAKGVSVSVAGTTAGDGTVTASSITAR